MLNCWSRLSLGTCGIWITLKVSRKLSPMVSRTSYIRAGGRIESDYSILKDLNGILHQLPIRIATLVASDGS